MFFSMVFLHVFPEKPIRDLFFIIGPVFLKRFRAEEKLWLKSLLQIEGRGRWRLWTFSDFGVQKAAAV